jgi:hypothetical protein
MGHEHNVLGVTHGWNTAIGLAADLHLSAMSVAQFVEYLTPYVYLDEISTVPPRRPCMLRTLFLGVLPLTLGGVVAPAGSSSAGDTESNAPGSSFCQGM